ncbi:MAG: HAD-IA family hydrolase [Synechococcus sp.]
MSGLQAVFWDVDGTLADTEMEGHRPAFNQAFADLGVPWHWDRPLYQRLLMIPGGGQRMAHYAEHEGPSLHRDTLERLKQVKQTHYLNRIRSGAVMLRPGVARLLAELKTAGVQQWIVTSSGQASVSALLEGLFPDAKNPFTGVVSANDVQRHKPHPDPYRCALERSGIDATACLSIEDSAAGLLASTQASIPCLVTPSPWDQQLSASINRAVAVVNHLGDLHQPLQQTSGPPCVDGLITLEYLQLLVETTR